MFVVFYSMTYLVLIIQYCLLLGMKVILSSFLHLWGVLNHVISTGGEAHGQQTTAFHTLVQSADVWQCKRQANYCTAVHTLVRQLMLGRGKRQANYCLSHTCQVSWCLAGGKRQANYCLSQSFQISWCLAGVGGRQKNSLSYSYSCQVSWCLAGIRGRHKNSLSHSCQVSWCLAGVRGRQRTAFHTLVKSAEVWLFSSLINDKITELSRSLKS